MKANLSLDTPEDRSSGLWTLIGAAVVAVLLTKIPVIGPYIGFPFRVLGIWFHEMGHGMTAILLGGTFYELELHPFNGLATSGGYALGPLGHGIVAGGGPLGPAVAGSLLIMAGRYAKLSKFTLLALSAAMFLSAVLLMPILPPKGPFGMVFISIVATVVGYVALKAPLGARRLTVQFLGVQAGLSMFSQGHVGYLFSSQAASGHSDTAIMAQNLLLPHWFWAGFLVGSAFLMMAAATWWAYRK